MSMDEPKPNILTHQCSKGPFASLLFSEEKGEVLSSEEKGGEAHCAPEAARACALIVF